VRDRNLDWALKDITVGDREVQANDSITVFMGASSLTGVHILEAIDKVAVTELHALDCDVMVNFDILLSDCLMS